MTSPVKRRRISTRRSTSETRNSESTTPGIGPGSVATANKAQEQAQIRLPNLSNLKLELPSDLPKDHLCYKLTPGSGVDLVLQSGATFRLKCEKLVALDSYSAIFRASVREPGRNSDSPASKKRPAALPKHYGLRVYLMSRDVMGATGSQAASWDFEQRGACLEEARYLKSDLATTVQCFHTGTVLERPAMLISDCEATLTQLLQHMGSLPVALARRLVEVIAASLTNSSLSFVYHRNLNPSVVLLHADPDAPYQLGIRLGGFAATTACMGANGQPAVCSKVASFSKMAPEVDYGQKYSEAADVYALGMLVLEMLDGSCPWEYLWEEAQSKSSKKTKRIKQAFSRMEHYRNLKLSAQDLLGKKGRYAKIPAFARTMVLPMLHKDAEARPSLADVLLHAWVES